MMLLILVCIRVIMHFFKWQPSQSLILGPGHNQSFGATDAPILDFGHLDC